MASELQKFLKGISGYHDEFRKNQSLGQKLGYDKANFDVGGKFFKLTQITAATKALSDMAAGILDKYAKYQQMKFDINFQKNAALANAEVEKLSSAVAAWSDSMKGASQSLKAYTKNVTDLSKVQRENELKYEKYKTDLVNDAMGMIPIFGNVFSGLVKSINSYRDQLLEQEHQEMQKRLELSQQYIDKAMEMADTTKKYLDTVDKEIVAYARRNSLSVEQTEVLRKVELAHAEYYATLNATVEDAMKIMNNYRNATGRAVNMSLDETMKSIAAGKIVGEDIVANTQSELYLFNKSAGDVADMMVRTQNSVGRMGLSTQKVMKSISDNMKLAQEFQFKSGTAGLREMTILAENLRFNMSSLSGMLSKIQSGGLEGVIKQSAQLQVLGGNIGMGADPFALAYNAFQDPKQMMENVSKMLKGFGTFNRATGETEFAINEQIRLGAFAEAMGMSKADVMNMVREQNKKEVVRGLITDSRFTEEQLSAISNLATRSETGEWKVSTISGESVDVRNLRPQDLERLLASNKEDQAIQYAQAQLSTTERIEAITKSIDAAVGGTLWQSYEKTVNKANEQTLKSYTENSQDISNSIKDTWDEQNNQQGKMLTTLNNFYNEYLKSQTEFKLSGILSKAERDITAEDRETASKLISQQLKTFMSEYGIQKGQLFNEDWTLKSAVYDSEEIRRMTGGKASFAPINESQLKKLGLLRHSFREQSAEDMIYGPTSGVHPILTTGDVRTHLSDNDIVIAMKQGGPIASANQNSVNGGKVEVVISGSIKLDGNGVSINLAELSKNPIFIRNIEQMIAESRFSRANGTHDYR